MKYKVGDKVLIRKDLVPNKMYGGECIDGNPGKEDWLGKVVTIEDMRFGTCYHMKECPNWRWSDEMIEKKVKDVINKKYKEGDKVRIKKNLSEIDDPWGTSPEKLKMAGTIQTILNIGERFDGNGKYYSMASDPFWCFTEEMLECKRRKHEI